MKTLWGASLVDCLPPIVLWLVSVGFLAAAYGFNAASGAMPILIGWTMVVLTALDLLTRMRMKLGDFLARTLNPSALNRVHEPAPRGQAIRQLVVVVTMLVYLAAMLLVGVLPTVPVFMLVALRFGAGRGWLVSVVGAAGMVLLVWAVFARLLGLEIFPGLLFDGDW